MVVQVQVLSVSSVEMAPCLLLSTESQRFLIDVGDGTQRMCMEHRVRLAKLKHVFLTQLRAHTLGGLPGMVLTVSDTGKDALRVFGPPGTQRYLAATRHFLFRPDFALQGVDLQPHAQLPTACYADSEVQVFAVVTGRAKAGVKRKLHASASSNSSADEAAPPANDCVSYVIETLPQRGKFLVERAAALGVPKGKLFGQLHQGKDVTLPDGRVVRSADCVTSTLPAAGCAVIACPSVAYVDELVRSSSGGFRRYQHGAVDAADAEQQASATAAAGAPEVQLEAVFHLAAPEVLQHPKYAAWVARFGADVEHVLLSHDACPRKTVYRASATLQAQLQSVFPRAFPANDSELQDAEAPLARRVTLPFAPASKPALPAESMLRFTLAPAARRGVDASACWQRLDLDEVRASTAAVRERLQQAAATATASASSTSAPTPALAVHGRITFLGTGCAIPSKYRNVTGMYLEIDKPAAAAAGATAGGERASDWSGFMLDCGEGSFGQLVRYANGDARRLRALVTKLRCVWISHNHADHHLGLVRLLSQRRAGDDEAEAEEAEPLLVVGPTNVARWLDEYSAVDPSVAGAYRFVDNCCFDELDARFQEAAAASKAARAWLREALGVTQFECVPVTHSFQSYALVATFGEALTVAFSGDCRPSARFAAKARGAFLMVHEATFEDALAGEARSKCHCTTAEAVDVGRRADATHLILTHFSQRYPKMPVREGGDGGDVLSAIDLLSLRFDELRQPQLMDVCAELMALGDAADGEEEEDNNAAAK